MALDVQAVQQALAAQGLDGWLLYDFQGLNQVAQRVAGLKRDGHMTTRRWFVLIPTQGEPVALVHAIERHNLDHVPGEKIVYAGRTALESGLERLLRGRARVAMEYSPLCAIPYVSRVDAGTIELVRRTGVEVVSSGDLVQQFEARWSDAQIETHLAASAALYRIKDRAFDEAARRIRDGVPTTELDIQRLMQRWFEEEGLVSDSAPMVSAQENAGNPHYMPSEGHSRPVRAGELLLLDLWGKRSTAGAVFADITWVGFLGKEVPTAMRRAFAAIRDARDTAIAAVEDAVRAGRDIRGFEVDRAARLVIEGAGYGANILHRTGHSLGETVHGNGAHLDDYETRDERRLMPGCGFTIEPGVYFAEFGVRTEVNMVWGPDGPTVTGERQAEILALG